MIDLSYWFMFPLSIVVATIAMTAGIGGAVLFSPIFFLLLNLKPDVAIGTGIFIEIFGFSSGFIGYAKEKLIDYHLGKQILILAVPFALIGVFLGKIIAPSVLQLIFGVAIIILAFSFIHKERPILVKDKRFHELHLKLGTVDRCLKIEHDKELVYVLSALGGLFLGLLSAGLGEINEYNFIKKIKLKGAIAAGTSVFIVVITALIASLSHFYYMATHFSADLLLHVVNIIIFAAPGVIVGAQLGVRIAQRINTDTTKKFFICAVYDHRDFIHSKIGDLSKAYLAEHKKQRMISGLLPWCSAARACIRAHQMNSLPTGGCRISRFKVI